MNMCEILLDILTTLSTLDKIHHAISPLLDTYVGKRHRKPVEDALQSYNSLRSEVLRHDDNAHSALAAVRRIPNLNL